MRKKIVLLDSDVISHFIAAGKIDDLNKILSPHILMIVRQVYEESSYHPFFEDRKMELDEWINKYHIRIIEFPYDNENIKLEFYRIKKENPRFGKGERACMAIAKYEKQVIASSNFKDVAEYCEINGIEYMSYVSEELRVKSEKSNCKRSACLSEKLKVKNEKSNSLVANWGELK